jgi:hypothetical protein
MKTKGLLSFLEKNSPAIMTGLGITFLGSSTLLAIRETPVVLELIEDRKEELEVDNLPPMELVKVGWKPYLPSIITFIVGSGLVISGVGISSKRNALLATACTMSEEAFRNYASKTLEVVGEEKEREIREYITRDRVQGEKIPSEDKNFYMFGDGDVLCIDGISGREFMSNMANIRSAENDLNRQLNDENYVSLNDYYYSLDLDTLPIGDRMGWNYEDGKIEFVYSSILNKKGIPCLVVETRIFPEHSYKESYR